MKRTVHGFSQKHAVDLGLEADHLLILRWFVDWQQYGDMEWVEHEGNEYFWVNQNAVTDELPILGVSSRRAIRRRLDKLVEAGVLEKHKAESGRAYYAVNSTAFETLCISDQGWAETPRGVGGNAQGPLRSDCCTKDCTKEKESTKEKENGTDNIPYEKVRELWNTFAKQTECPRIRKITKKRKKKLRKRWPEWGEESDPIEYLKQVLKTAGKQPFLQGENDNGWRMDFDFLIRSEDSAIKILEKKYLDSNNNKPDWRRRLNEKYD